MQVITISCLDIHGHLPPVLPPYLTPLPSTLQTTIKVILSKGNLDHTTPLLKIPSWSPILPSQSLYNDFRCPIQFGPLFITLQPLSLYSIICSLHSGHTPASYSVLWLFLLPGIFPYLESCLCGSLMSFKFFFLKSALFNLKLHFPALPQRSKVRQGCPISPFYSKLHWIFSPGK